MVDDAGHKLLENGRNWMLVGAKRRSRLVGNARDSWQLAVGSSQ